MRWTTEIALPAPKFQLSLHERLVSLGSCFSDEIGRKLSSAGFDILINPFGTLYNPESIASAVQRLNSAAPFTSADCVPMGAGAGKICSFSHHSSFAREDQSAFLTGANASLQQASQAWQSCSAVLITLGSAMVWRRGGLTVANCLKRPSREFTHEMLSLSECITALETIVQSCSGKRFIFTISPIRYLSCGARANSISKSTLHLALSHITELPNCEYFPAYEIQLDELRDYRYYAADLLHPRDIAVDYIWARFKDQFLQKSELPIVCDNEKLALARGHIEKQF